MSLENIRVLFPQVLSVKRNVAAPFIQMLRDACIGLDSGIFYVKITNDPVFYQPPKLACRIKSTKLSKALQCENVGRVKILFLPVQPCQRNTGIKCIESLRESLAFSIPKSNGNCSPP